MKLKKTTLLGLLLICIYSCTTSSEKETVISQWLTTADKSSLFKESELLSFNNQPLKAKVIEIDSAIQYQHIDGFGFALTQGSAEVLMRLDSEMREELLKDLYKNGQSIVRISIGASDLSNSVYSYNENKGDVVMKSFNINGPDKEYLLPVLKEIMAINPDIKIIATPWTAPTWMKTNESWIGGSLKEEYYAAYAHYLVLYIKKMGELGFPIWAITPQNEPENDHNEPSMLMTKEEQLEFIDKHLGPAFQRNAFPTKIIAFDHNCDNSEYPIHVLENTKYADGAAFHLYAGSIETMGEVYQRTGKNVYFTEQYTGSNGDFGGDLEWHIKNVLIGSLRNYAKTVIEWNLATDENFGPHTEQGCNECLGAITIRNENEYSKNVSHYVIAHLAKFVQSGAVRIESTDDEEIKNIAFKNLDGSIVLLIFNTKEEDKEFSIKMGKKTLNYSLPGKTVATLKW